MTKKKPTATIAEIIAAAKKAKAAMSLPWFKYEPGTIFWARWREDRTILTPKSKYQPSRDVHDFEVLEVEHGELGAEVLVPVNGLIKHYLDMGADGPETILRIEYLGKVSLENGNQAHDFNVDAYEAQEDGSVIPWRWIVDPANPDGPKILALEVE